MNEPRNGRPPKWNLALYQAARKAGCSKREAEVLAVYVESPNLDAAASSLGISPQTAKNHMHAIHRKLGLRHTSAVVARILASA